MRAVIQRVSRAQVTVAGSTVGSIPKGLLVLLGAGQGDTDQDLDYIYRKTIGLRIFPDAADKMNLNLQQVGGQLLVVSQFTLYGDCRKGMRPSFVGAESPEEAKHFYEQFIARARAEGIPTQTGEFQTSMQVELTNDGPVTILLDSRGDLDRK